MVTWIPNCMEATNWLEWIFLYETSPSSLIRLWPILRSFSDTLTARFSKEYRQLLTDICPRNWETHDFFPRITKQYYLHQIRNLFCPTPYHWILNCYLYQSCWQMYLPQKIFELRSSYLCFNVLKIYKFNFHFTEYLNIVNNLLTQIFNNSTGLQNPEQLTKAQ